MGEVWRARDVRLNREVAIKVLPCATSFTVSRRRESPTGAWAFRRVFWVSKAPRNTDFSLSAWTAKPWKHKDHSEENWRPLNMKPNDPSRTALLIARQRAAHQLLDHGSVLNDPFAMKILGAEEKDGVKFA